MMKNKSYAQKIILLSTAFFISFLSLENSH